MRPVVPPLPSPWKGSLPNFLLLGLTAVSVYLSGGIRLVIGAFSILLAHEMGHYVACRIHRVDATLPYFIPFPIFSFVGTLGAFIRIRDPFPNRKVLFDIGIAGPFAGFLACIPVLVFGIWEARLVPYNPAPGLPYMGEPLAFRWMAELLLAPIPPGMTLEIGPLGVAGWFGLFLTALNMMPIGQLDGGHVIYSVFRERALYISRAALAVTVFLLYLRPTWILWTVLLLVLARRPHPPTLDDRVPLGRTRTWLAALGFLMFAVCFTPSPFIVSWTDFFGALGEMGGQLASWLTSR